ncbi:hypothetical protein SAMD00019534_067620, partial [Acytostelium subglobosum LB1]|uniref:hypothetical protein n=1 Tax=Acytostelium subglobosum LB1 TaxID=1410327 RepID=UPI000644FCC8
MIDSERTESSTTGTAVTVDTPIADQHKEKDIDSSIHTTTTTSTTNTNTNTNTTLVVEAPAAAAEIINIRAKWSGKEFKVSIEKTNTILDLKRQLETLTNVLTKRQKILGLSKGLLPPDETVIGSLNIPPNHSIIMMGTPEAQIIQAPPPSDADNVFNDLEFDYIPDSDELSHLEENKSKLVKIREKAEIAIINAPRANKKLLVLDLDHTLLDFKDQDVANMKRPYLEEFLTASYEHYDIAIWSQTSWKWIEIKLTELGMLTNPNFKIGFVLDQTLMFSVTTYRALSGKERTKIKHQVKALDIIWSHKVLGQYYTAKNTLHVDDLSKNFAMNPKNGVHIPAFKIKEQKQPDNVLYHLSHYLKIVATESDVTKVNHNV